MRILADENVAPGLIDAIRKAGYSVLSCDQVSLQSAKDEAYLERSLEECDLLLSSDKDFGYLRKFHFRGDQSRVLLLRFHPFILGIVVEKTLAALDEIRLEAPHGPLMAVLTDSKLRLRREYDL